ncbi:MAG: phosphoribosylformylglycinamidine synthase subunit PurQ, partial [Verrucomicrobiota bacterium]
FKQAGNTVSLVEVPETSEGLPDYPRLLETCAAIAELNASGAIVSAKLVGRHGLDHALAVSCFGNLLGFDGSTGLQTGTWHDARPSAFIIEHGSELPSTLHPVALGRIIDEPILKIGDESHSLTDLLATWESTLEPVYPTKPTDPSPPQPIPQVRSTPTRQKSQNRPSTPAKPRVIIPAFPGTNSEYDSAKVFREAGAESEILVFRNLTTQHIEESLDALADEIRRSQILFIPGGFSSGDEPDGSAKFITAVLRAPKVADAVMDLLHQRDGLILGICNGFQALIKTGLVPYGGIREPAADSPTLFHNEIGRHVSRYVRTRVTSTLSPWLAGCENGDIHSIPVSHGEGRLVATPELISELAESGRIATQYCDANGAPSMEINHNPNGSAAAIEGLTSPCGRVFGKMSHTERRGTQVAKNLPGEKHQPLFKAGVNWFS